VGVLATANARAGLFPCGAAHRQLLKRRAK
jgi:hypothetical protein